MSRGHLTSEERNRIEQFLSKPGYERGPDDLIPDADDEE